MTVVAYDTDEINDLSRRNLAVATDLAPLTLESLASAADVGFADVAGIVGDPVTWGQLRFQLGVVVADAVEASLNSGVLGADLYHQAVLYVAAETGLPPAVVISQQLVDRGQDAWAEFSDLYLGDIDTTTIDDDVADAGPDRTLDLTVEIGGSWRIVTAEGEIDFRVEQYGDSYRVIMSSTVFAGVGTRGSGGASAGAESTIELSWDVTDLDSVRRLLARLAPLGPGMLLTVAQGPLSPNGLLTGAVTALAGHLLDVPMPRSGTVTGGLAADLEGGSAAAGAGIGAGVDLDFTDGGLPELTPFGQVEVDASVDVGPGTFEGSASVRVDPEEITIQLDGTVLLTRGIATPSGGAGGTAGTTAELAAGAGVHGTGTVTIPTDALDADVVEQLALGAPSAIAEVMRLVREEGSGSLGLYAVVDAAGEFDASGVVTGGASVRAEQRVHQIDFDS